jgi:hypothetical protein
VLKVTKLPFGIALQQNQHLLPPKDKAPIEQGTMAVGLLANGVDAMRNQTPSLARASQSLMPLLLLC